MKIAVKSILSVLPLLFCSPAFAQMAPPLTDDAPPQEDGISAQESDGLGDIVITATKRTTNLQETPIAVTAFDTESLAEAQVSNVANLQGLVPGLQVSLAGASPLLVIRGVGLNSSAALSEGSVAVNLNEVFISRLGAQLSGFYDVASLEVLRGPQGTLYGRNATAGSINISTARPTNTWSGYGRLSFGNYNSMFAEGAVGGPLVDDTVLIRIAGQAQNRDGFGRNIVTGAQVDNLNTRALRGTLVVKPTKDVTATIIAEYYDRDDNSASPHFRELTGSIGLPGQSNRIPYWTELGGYNVTDSRDVAQELEGRLTIETIAFTGILEAESGPFSAKSITGYREFDSSALGASAGGGFPTTSYFRSGGRAEQFSQELQLNAEIGILSLTSGVFYFQETDRANPNELIYSRGLTRRSAGVIVNDPTLVRFITQRGQVKTEAKAVYAQGTVNVTPELSLTAGIRYSTEDKDFTQNLRIDATAPLNAPMPPPVFRQASFSATNPKFGVQYQFTPKILAYGSYTQGFRAGTFDITSSTVLQPEQVEAWEGGLKTTLLDNRLRANLSGFHYDYTNLQVTTSNGVQFINVSAGAARLWGGELELSALPIPELQLDFTAAYVNSEFTAPYIGNIPSQPGVGNTDYQGNQLPNAPEWRLHAGGEYTWPLDGGAVKFRTTVDYTTRNYLTPAQNEIQSQDPYARIDASVSYRADAGWSVTAFATNLTDETIWLSSQLNNVSGSIHTGVIAPPRQFGLEFGYRF